MPHTNATIRCMSWNILGCRGFMRDEDPAHGTIPARPWLIECIVSNLRNLNCDIICLQECPEQGVVEYIARALNMELHYFPSFWPGDATWPGGFPGATLSRWPLTERCNERARCKTLTDTSFTRFWGSSLCATPLGQVRIVNCHLCADWGGNMNESVRISEINALIDQLSSENTAKILMADWNCEIDSTPLQALQRAGAQDCYNLVKPVGCPFSNSSLDPLWRIDHIFIHNSPQLHCTEAGIIDRPPFGSEPSAAAPFALSDHLPVFAVLEER